MSQTLEEQWSPGGLTLLCPCYWLFIKAIDPNICSQPECAPELFSALVITGSIIFSHLLNNKLIAPIKRNKDVEMRMDFELT